MSISSNKRLEAWQKFYGRLEEIGALVYDTLFHYGMLAFLIWTFYFVFTQTSLFWQIALVVLMVPTIPIFVKDTYNTHRRISQLKNT